MTGITLRTLFQGLNAISQDSFPRKCKCCNREFNSMEEFLAETCAVGESSGLKGSLDDEDEPIVELFRNCSCGSTLLEFCSSRRDNSPAGNRRRERFGELMVLLESNGIDESLARQELLKMLRGEKSELIEKIRRMDC